MLELDVQKIYRGWGSGGRVGDIGEGHRQGAGRGLPPGEGSRGRTGTCLSHSAAEKVPARPFAC